MEKEDYGYDFAEAKEEYEGSGPDNYFLEVQQRIREIFEKERQSVFYVRQMQIKFEKQYFHWITYNALEGLCKLGYLKDIRTKKETGTSVRYFMHKSNRYPMRQINKIEKLIAEYSDDNITRSCGHRAEDLFIKGLALKEFIPKAQKVRSYGGITWDQSQHDLDFVFEKDGIAYGCEIKNTLGYIQKEELEIKLNMCGLLGLKPLFIMRYSPKVYNDMIIKQGGFALLFVSQIYELSQASLVKRMKEELGLPVDCHQAIPEGIINRFVKWHEKKLVK